MPAASAYGWLVANGLWTGIMGAATGAVTVGLLGWAWAKAKKLEPVKLLREHVHEQKRIADALDTSTPGGLSEIVNTMKEDKR